MISGGRLIPKAQTRLTPSILSHSPDIYDLPTTNGDHSTGDGIKMALSLGANAIHMEKVQVHPTGLVDPQEPDAKVKVSIST